MLFFITGANGVGKTACLPALARLLPDFVVHDFADLGVPANPDARWRQETTELWLRTYLEKHQPQRRNAVVSGRSSTWRDSRLPFHRIGVRCVPHMFCSTVTMSRESIVCARVGSYGLEALQILCWGGLLARACRGSKLVPGRLFQNAAEHFDHALGAVEQKTSAWRCGSGGER